MHQLVYYVLQNVTHEVERGDDGTEVRAESEDDESESEGEEAAEVTDGDSEASDEDATAEYVGTTPIPLASTYKKAIAKVRKICRHFRKSPKQNDHLQEHIFKRLGKRKKLKIDVKTRWSSMSHMLKRWVYASIFTNKVSRWR